MIDAPQPETPLEAPPPPRAQPLPHDPRAPLLRAPEKIRTVFVVTSAAACAPLAAGIFFFGWRAAWVALVAVGSCALFERLYFRVTHTPALLGRSHAYLTGLLLALTLPAFTPTAVVVLAAAFAILIGKAIFGGVGHFLWQPALLGRFAATVLVSVLAQGGSSWDLNPDIWPVLSRQNVVFGDIRNAPAYGPDHNLATIRWADIQAPDGRDALAMRHPSSLLHDLTLPGVREAPAYGSLAEIRTDTPHRMPVALTQMPPMVDLVLGARPGGIGETCAVAILLGGIYLIYRNYVKWALPFVFLVSAGAVAAVAPVKFAGPEGEAVWMSWPLLREGLDVGFTYVNYQILSGGVLLAAFFLATEMTSRPITGGGQVIFGILGGAAAMLLKLYFDTAIPAYLAVLIANTATPTIDWLWRGRAFGQKRFRWVRKLFRKAE